MSVFDPLDHKYDFLAGELAVGADLELFEGVFAVGDPDFDGLVPDQRPCSQT